MLPFLVGLVVGASILSLDVLGALAGPPALVITVLLWVAIPSSHRLSRRLALNGAVALGVVPVLWWLPWPEAISVSHSAVILAAGAAIVAGWASVSTRARHFLIPSVEVADFIPFGALLISVWYFKPFGTYDSGVASIALLRRAFGNDNVAHFDMFEMIRRNLVSGIGWPLPRDGSLFAYVPYPQHFHSFAAFLAELWSGADLRSVDSETGLYGVAVSLAIGAGFVTLIAAIVSMRTLRGRWVLAGIAATSVFSSLLLGFGSTALSFGFPPYLFAIISTLIAVVIALDSGVARNVELLAVGAAIVAVAHSWSLLTPIAGIALVTMLARMPWPLYQRKVYLAVLAVVISVASLAGVGFAFYLVIAATSPVGSPDSVLSTGGAIPTTSIPLTFGVAFALIALSVVILAQSRRRRLLFGRSGAFVLFASVAAVAVLEAAALIAVQLIRADSLSYFQFKFINAIYLLLVVLFVLAGALATAILAPRRAQRERGRSIALMVGGAAAVVAILLSAGTTTPAQAGIGRDQFPGLQFRFNLNDQAQRPTGSDARLIEAASVMAEWPCARPVYVGGYPDDPRLEESNQWAMSLSSTWTEESGDINRFLVSRYSERPLIELDSIVVPLLEEEEFRCVVIAPGLRQALAAETLETFGTRIFSW
jgi:hypothetical protein